MFSVHVRRISTVATAAFCAALFSAGLLAQPTACIPDPGTDQGVSYGDQISCAIDPAGDSDIFRFSASAGDTPLITMTVSGGPIDPCLELFEEGNPTPIATDCPGFGEPASLSPSLTADGTFTIVTSELDDNEIGTYILELQCLVGTCAPDAPPGLFGYTPVEPCRIVDTRFGIGGAFSANETRSFHTYGDISDQNQGAGGAPAEYPTECPFAGEHGAAHLNVTVVPLQSGGAAGFVAVWPHGSVQPAASLVNFKRDLQNIANAAVVATNESDAATPDISVFAKQPLHLVIDVMGYYTR